MLLVSETTGHPGPPQDTQGHLPHWSISPTQEANTVGEEPGTCRRLGFPSVSEHETTACDAGKMKCEGNGMLETRWPLVNVSPHPWHSLVFLPRPWHSLVFCPPSCSKRRHPGKHVCLEGLSTGAAPGSPAQPSCWLGLCAGQRASPPNLPLTSPQLSPAENKVFPGSCHGPELPALLLAREALLARQLCL